MIISASIKNIRISPVKVKALLDRIKGLSFEKALELVSFSSKKAAFFLEKLLRSIVANSEHNHGCSSDNLYIYRIYVCKGFSLKRINIRAKGRSDKIIKQNCHIFIQVKEKGK